MGINATDDLLSVLLTKHLKNKPNHISGRCVALTAIFEGFKRRILGIIINLGNAIDIKWKMRT